MKEKIITLTAAVVAFLLFILPSACGGATAPESVAAAPTSAPDVTDTPLPAPTTEPEATSPPEGEGDSGAAAESTDEIVITRTPQPTATPGAIQDVVTEFTVATGLEGETFLGLTADDWINLGISLLTVLVGYLLATWLLRRLLRRVVQRTASEFDDALLENFGSQLRWLIVILCLQFATTRLGFLGADVKLVLRDIYYIAAWAILLLAGWRLINFAFAWYRQKVAAEEDLERLSPILTLLRRMALSVLVVVGVSIVLTHFGVNVTALTAALGIAGLAFSLAAQDTLADAISGFVILLDQPFRVGDRIEISGLGTWGDVVEIGSRTTRIRTRDNRMVIVPNSIIGKSQVVNYTFPDPQYRVQIDIGIGYGMDIERTRQIIIHTVRQVEGILPDKPVDALYNEMGDSSMTFRVRWWIQSYEDTRLIYDRVNTALQHALDAAGIDMPFTTYDLNVKIDAEKASQMSQLGTGDPPVA